MASMKEIARLAGVSQSTVSRVINGHDSVHPELRERVMKWVRELQYEPNANARSLVKSRTNLIGVVVPDISNPFFPSVVQSVLGEVNRHGRSVLLFDTEGSVEMERRALDRLRGHRVEGILLVPADARAGHLSRLQSDLPVVIMTQSLEGFYSVATDHEAGGRIVANHLLDLGHTRIGYLGSTKDEKFRGFAAALADGGAPFDPKWLIESHSWIELASNRAYEQMKAFLQQRGMSDPDQRMTALFAYNDLAALGAIRALEERGLRVPDDVAVVGFDNTAFATVSRPRLTSVAQANQEIGRLAAEMLFYRLDGKELGEARVTLPPRLVVRESTRGIVLDEQAVSG